MKFGTWRLRPFLFLILIAFNGILLLLVSVGMYFSVQHFFTQQTIRTRLEMLYFNQQHLDERIRQIEETALSISTNRTIIEAFSDGETHDLYESVVLRRNLNDWINQFTFIKPYITSIQIYSDTFNDTPIPGGESRSGIFPLAFIPWEEHIERLQQVDAIWIPSHPDEYSVPKGKPVLTYVLKLFDLS